jgi:predicted TIM-barrel fold metal-dependent hydrolase
VLRADQLTAAARLARDLPEVRFVLDHLGKPVCLVAATYRRVRRALAEALPPLSPTERAAVFGGTAARTYDLRP